MTYAYLLINFLTIIFPILLSFDKRVAFHKSWKYIWPAMGITGLVFLFWDVLFTLKGVWSFNSNYIIGIRFWGLPLEEILFFLTVPFSCIFIYACLNHYVKWSLPQTAGKAISVLIIILSIVMLVIYHDRLYTTITFGLLLALVAAIQFGYKPVWLPRFYMAYIVSLLPFYIVNGILTSVPIVLYNNAENIGKRVGTIPFEDHFYSLALLLMNVAFFEYFKNKSKSLS
ncbi:lycopene cyclase domain-containing protein [uncultured Mucilaginibacter sp.]|uniref:lycopene cyclase domain-containing protein n=1 Tax=uncultured Mucilaginibacter sp. TaxID=797541 RepID=UPI0025FFB4F4|nr:lycopene cyclase domain-containing protein [uncultured Mucilaginibacter sp.]